MNYVTTNIRIPEEDYLRLKIEAAKARKSFSAVVREKIGSMAGAQSDAEVEKFMVETEKVAQKLGKYTKGFNLVRSLREMRYEEK